MKVLILCAIFTVFAWCASYRFNRHCCLCNEPVLVEWSLTRGVLGYVGDVSVVHRKCFIEWNGSGKLQNFYTVEGVDYGNGNVGFKRVHNKQEEAARTPTGAGGGSGSD